MASHTESTRPKDEDEDEEEEEEDDEKLEEEIKEMSKKLIELRSTLPSHLNSTVSSLLFSLRPSFSLSYDVSFSGCDMFGLIATGSIVDCLVDFEGARKLFNSIYISSSANSCSETVNGEVAAKGGERMTDDIKLLNDKISSNISAIPKVLKRMNDCLSRIDTLVSSNESIHPIFKRKRRC